MAMSVTGILAIINPTVNIGFVSSELSSQIPKNKAAKIIIIVKQPTCPTTMARVHENIDWFSLVVFSPLPELIAREL